jgi:hypothetical protein
MNRIGTAPAPGAGGWDDGPSGPDALRFSCRPGEGVVLAGPHVRVRVLAVMSDRVRIGVEAPGGAHVVREGTWWCPRPRPGGTGPALDANFSSPSRALHTRSPG